ncbi:hypothetical protein P3805_24035 [Pseudomonas aeruginosa]|nr:hypothetical protein [Pseudomonas aeruginosa]
MRKHTPGPWGIERLHGEINVISCNERDGAAKDMGIVYVLARDVGGMIHGEQFDDRSEVEANARLMAAAPDLMDALVALVDASKPHQSFGKQQEPQSPRPPPNAPWRIHIGGEMNLTDPKQDDRIRAALRNADKRGQLQVVAAITGIAGGVQELRKIMNSTGELSIMDRGMLALHLS